MSHFFLLLFCIIFILSWITALNLQLNNQQADIFQLKKLKNFFIAIGLFFLFWFLSEYIVLNILPEDTIVYALLESLGFIWIGIATWFLFNYLLPVKYTKQVKYYKAIFYIIIVLLISCRLSNHIFNTHLLFFHWLKNLVLLLLMLFPGTTALLSIIKKENNNNPLIKLKKTCGIITLLLIISAIIDIKILKVKLVQEVEKLGSAFLLFNSVFILSLIILNIFLIRFFKSINKKNKLSPSILKTWKITTRESEIIAAICNGKTNQQIADEHFISLATVKNHIHNIFQKCSATSRYQIIKLFSNSSSPLSPAEKK